MAGAQAAMLGTSDITGAKVRLLVAESCTKILAWEGHGEGLEREEVLRTAARAKRRCEVSVWETMCRRIVQQVDWERVEAMGGWAADALQWGLNGSVLLRHKRNWDRGGLGAAPGLRRGIKAFRHGSGNGGKRFWAGT